MQIAHKIEIYPNNIQKTYLNKCFGVSRFTYNWALAEWQKKYKNKENTSGMSLKKEFNSIKKEQFPWTKKVTKWACQQPFLDLQNAFNKFFKKQSGYPKFKKKNKSSASCYIASESCKVENFSLKLPLLKSKIKMSEVIRFNGKINSVTLSKKANRYFASFQLDVTDATKDELPNRSIGVDIGIKSLFVTSDSHEVQALKPLRNNLRRLKRYSRKLSKKVRGSKNSLKAKTKLSRLHFKISNQRKDVLHKFTTFLCSSYSIINVEDLSAKNMVKNHKLALAISDIGVGEFKRQLDYKSKLYGNVLNFADRFYPSSKLCSACGNKKEDLKLSDRVYSCEKCGLELDRDFNASLNIKKIGGAPTEFTPVEITALQNKVFPYFVSSIVETGIKLQIV
jgi:putative transposase